MVLRGRLAAAAGDQAAARAAWQEALDLLAASRESHWRVLAPRAAALAALGRSEEARAEVARLQRMGYRRAGFEELVRQVAPAARPESGSGTAPK